MTRRRGGRPSGQDEARLGAESLVVGHVPPRAQRVDWRVAAHFDAYDPTGTRQSTRTDSRGRRVRPPLVQSRTDLSQPQGEPAPSALAFRPLSGATSLEQAWGEPAN